MPKRGGGKEESKTTQYERRFGDDRRNTRRRLLRPWFDFGRDLGGVCYVCRSEIKTNKRKEHTMKKYKVSAIINLHFHARSMEEAERIAGDMDYEFTHPDKGEKINQEIIDWEIIAE